METPGTPATYPDITLGILAGGRATRLGGIDKAWLQRDGLPQVMRLRHAFHGRVADIHVSANRDLPHYRHHGLHAVVDRVHDAGPLAGIDALLASCKTAWLLTLPVDVVLIPPGLIERLVDEGQGAFAEDDDGAQPLIASWCVAKARIAIQKALAAGAFAVHELQARLDMQARRIPDFRFGNLNTPHDLDAAGITPAPSHPSFRESHG